MNYKFRHIIRPVVMMILASMVAACPAPKPDPPQDVIEEAEDGTITINLADFAAANTHTLCVVILDGEDNTIAGGMVTVADGAASLTAVDLESPHDVHTFTGGVTYRYVSWMDFDGNYSYDLGMDYSGPEDSIEVDGNMTLSFTEGDFLAP